MKWLKLSAFIVITLMSTFLRGIIVPPQPPFSVPPPDNLLSGFLPFVLVNDSNLDDSEVYVFVSGVDPVSSANVFGEINQTTGQVTFIPITAENVNTINSTQYTLPLSSLPLAYPTSDPTSTDRVLFSPYVNGGLIWYSLLAPLNMPGVEAGETFGYQQPAFNNPNDPNYFIRYSNFEYAFSATPTQVVGDATAVSYFGLPLYGYISTPDVNTRANTGLYQPLKRIFKRVLDLFNPVESAPIAAERIQWNNLVLYNDQNEVIRVISPAKSISAANIPPLVPMDPDYFDNQPAYLYSYYQQGLLDYYRTHTLTMSLANTPGSGATYTGVVNFDGSITLTSETTPYVITIAAPTPPGTAATSTTTYNIFAGLLIASSPDAGSAEDVQQLSKLFEEAIIAGLLPTSEVVSNAFLTENEENYYTYNPNLSPTTSATTGPWYDLYSKAFHSLGYIYTYAFDEPLWPQVQISSQFLQTSPPTYLAIRLGKSDKPAVRSNTQIRFTSTDNPSTIGTPIEFRAFVEAANRSGPITGYVFFTIDGVPQEPIRVINGKAQSRPYMLSPGRHLIRGFYTGDANHFPSKFRRLTQYITSPNFAATTTALCSSNNPSVLGERVHFTARVKNARNTHKKIGVPTGFVTFKVDGVIEGVVPLINQKATFTTGDLSRGKHRVVAFYQGDDNHSSSTSNKVIQVVERCGFSKDTHCSSDHSDTCHH